MRDNVRDYLHVLISQTLLCYQSTSSRSLWPYLELLFKLRRITMRLVTCGLMRVSCRRYALCHPSQDRSIDSSGEKCAGPWDAKPSSYTEGGCISREIKGSVWIYGPYDTKDDVPGDIRGCMYLYPEAGCSENDDGKGMWSFSRHGKPALPDLICLWPAS